MRRPRRGRHIEGDWAHGRILAWRFALAHQDDTDSIDVYCNRIGSAGRELVQWCRHCGWDDAVMNGLFDEANRAAPIQT